jgi:hypothetical protein
MSFANSTNSHNPSPGIPSKVGPVSGCGGPSCSAEALKQEGLFNVIKGGSKGCGCGCNCRCKNKNRCRKSCKCPCHNCMCQCHKKQKGGNGYGFSKNQELAPTSGVNMNGSVHLAGFSKYQNEGINSDTNMMASSQSGGSGYSYGTGGYPYYSYKPSEGENLSVFAGSGYPPISRGLNSQCGGKKRKTHKRKTHKKKGPKRKTHKRKGSKKKTHKKKGGNRKRKSTKKQRGGYSQYMSNVANTPSYSTGGVTLRNYESNLASPPPITVRNDCMNTWKHLGDKPPYNEVMG